MKTLRVLFAVNVPSVLRAIAEARNLGVLQ